MQKANKHVTVNQSMEGYFSTLELEHLKSDYAVITTELYRLNSLDKLLESTARKRAAVPTLEAKKKEMEEEYQHLYSVSKSWLEFSFSQKEKEEKKPAKEEEEKKENPAKEEKLQILLQYYMDIKANNMQRIINRLYPPQNNIISRKKKQARQVPRYRASNLRQEMHTAWKSQIESGT